MEPHGYVFAAPTGVAASLVGASPELLVSLHGGQVRATPLAGTASRAGDPDEDRASAEALAASAKNREEHQVVVRAVAAALAPLCDPLLVGSGAGPARDGQRVAPGDAVRRSGS